MLKRPDTDEIPDDHGPATAANRTDAMKRWRPLLRAGGSLLAVACLVWYASRLYAQSHIFGAIEFDGPAIGAVAFGVVAFPVMYAAVAAVWVFALRALGAELPLGVAAMICAITQFGKYMPGNVAHHLGRVVLAKRHGVSTENVVASMFLETANLFVCGLLVCLITWDRSSTFGSATFGAGAIGGLPGVPSRLWTMVSIALILVTLLIGLFAMRSRKLTRVIGRLRPRWLLGCVAVQTFVFWVNGAIAILLLRGVFNIADVSLASITGLYAVAWIAGFVTIGAPAGIGVREAVITLGLSASSGAGVAVGLAALLRVVSTLGDGLTFGLGLALQRRRKHCDDPMRNDASQELAVLPEPSE